jgi:class 3 adenylate cyclase
MFTDIVGSTEMTARLGDSAALELVRAHDALVRRGLGLPGGAKGFEPMAIVGAVRSRGIPP